MIKVDKTNVEIGGRGGELLVECALALADTANAISDGDNNFADATLYSVFMGAVRILHERHNIDIDTSFIGIQIVNATKE